VKSLKKPYIKPIKPADRFSKANLTVFALLFAAIGGYIIYSSFAAGFTTSFEAENSSKNSPATTVNDASASGGSALKFRQPGSCSGTPGQPDGIDPWGGCWPGPNTTGVPAGTTLANYTGPDEITAANTVIDGKILNFPNGLLISAPNVTIKNSRINGTVHVSDDTNNSLLIQDSEIICPHGSTGLGEAFVTVRRANIHDCENGFDDNQSINAQDSYIHGFSLTGHDDGFQMASGHFVNHQVVSGALNITIVHNTIYGHNDDFSATKNQEADFSTSGIISNPSGDTNILVQHNLMAGGGYTIYCPGGASTNYRILDNRFSNIFIGSIGFYNNMTGCNQGVTATGNVYNEDGCVPQKDGSCRSYKAGDPVPLD
jgi:hypothetical protein